MATDTGAPPRAWGGLQLLCQPLESALEHPHERGADVERWNLHRPERGAPPRARGGLAEIGQLLCECRSTPTSVGRTTYYLIKQ